MFVVQCVVLVLFPSSYNSTGCSNLTSASLLPHGLLPMDPPPHPLLSITLCSKAPPFELRHHLTTTIVDFGNLINLYPAHHADPVLWMFLAVMPVCRVSMHLLTDVVVDVRTCDVEGEEIFVSLRDEVLDCLLLVLYFYFLRMHMMCTFCCPSLLSLPRACRTLVLLICWRRRCWVAMS